LKSVEEINATSSAEQKVIEADADLQKAIIEGETVVSRTRDETSGKAEAELI
jgi:hypothetical protein